MKYELQVELENGRTLSIEHFDSFEILHSFFKETYVENFQGFKSWDLFWQHIVPRDVQVLSWMKRYEEGSLLRKKHLLSNGDVFIGCLKDDKVIGVGELYKKNDDRFDDKNISFSIGKFNSTDQFKSGIIRQYKFIPYQKEYEFVEYHGAYNNSEYLPEMYMGNKIQYSNGTVYEGTHANFMHIQMEKTKEPDYGENDPPPIIVEMMNEKLREYEKKMEREINERSEKEKQQKKDLEKSSLEKNQTYEKKVDVLKKMGVSESLIKELYTTEKKRLWKVSASIRWWERKGQAKKIHESMNYYFINTEATINRTAAKGFIKSNATKTNYYRNQNHGNPFYDNTYQHLDLVTIIDFFEVKYEL
jgi:hypothetical protein